MLRRSENIVHKILFRQIRTTPPSTQIHMVRKFYENLVPSYTVYDIECPDISIKKFTSDGQYLICFSRNHQELIAYRHSWPSFSWKGEDCEYCDLDAKERNFGSYFSHLYTLDLASGNEFICKDLFLSTENNQFGIVATQTAPDQDAPIPEGAIQGIPSVEKVTLFLFRLSDGEIMDTRVFHNDYIPLGHNLGVYLYDDLLSVISIRYQTIHILQIRDAGSFVDVRAIGRFCREDDELVLNSHSQRASCCIMHQVQQTPHNNSSDNFFGGMKQRLLSFNYQSIWKGSTDPAQRHQQLKRFYYNFQQYVDLIMWKVQFLDRHHILVKYGSVDGVLSRTPESQISFLAVYNMETTQMLAFYKNSSDELLSLFEQYCDHFRISSQYPLYMQFISTCSNNIHAREQLRKQKAACSKNESGTSQVAKKTLACLPLNCQSQSPSPYFDQYLFHFDEKLISSTDRHRQCMEHSIKFSMKRYPHWLKFKINPGLEIGATDGRTKRLVSFIFHPILPFALSVQHSFMQPSVVNVHIRR
eukprot:TRINITY_DN19092_c0_g1_i1.p1 TRINITY_DN19092_c0_g1~~TRINITY_DN19092_c0_g1_i1.p1  ORF type:complete len:529 (+),score=73.40 TRINITY_DN19092_c0_g1_i1:251-1837(+)